MATKIEFIPVSLKYSKFLYDMLAERDEMVNISHKEMPEYSRHIEFIRNHPYTVWFIIKNNKNFIGNIYLTKSDEIGIFIKKVEQRKGYGEKAVIKLIELFPRERYLANINPKNIKSISLFKKLEFYHIQNTYELRNI